MWIGREGSGWSALPAVPGRGPERLVSPERPAQRDHQRSDDPEREDEEGNAADQGEDDPRLLDPLGRIGA